MGIVLEKTLGRDGQQFLRLNVFKARYIGVHRLTVPFIGAAEEFSKLSFFPPDAVDHVEIINSRKPHQYPDIAGHHQDAENKEKAADIHGIAHKHVRPGLGQLLLGLNS